MKKLFALLLAIAAPLSIAQVPGSATGSSAAPATISSLSQLPAIPNGAVLGNNSGSSASPAALTGVTADTTGDLLPFGLIFSPALSMSGTYTRCTAGQNGLCGTMTLTGSENNGEYGAIDYLLSPGAFTNSFSSALVDVLKLKNGVNNSSAVGSFGGLESIVSIDGATGNNTGSGGQYVSGTFVAKSAINDNGGSGTEMGYLFGLNPTVQLLTGATHWQQLVGEEIDVTAQTSTSVLDKIGLSIVQKQTDAVSGSRDNLAFSIGNASGASAPWAYGISFGSYNGSWPIASTGTMIGCTAHAHTGSCGTTTAGIDFSNVTFTGNAYKSNAFSVDGSGNVTGNTLVSTVTTGTAPLTVTSTTNVPNLNASLLNGNTFASPSSIGSGSPSTGAFTTLSASSTVSGTGFSTYLASPPAIGGTAAAAVTGTTVTANTNYVHGVTTLCQASVASAASGGGSIAAAHTGNTSETNIAICTIPANVVPANGMLWVIADWYRSATTTDTVTFTVRDSATSGTTSAGNTYVATNATSGSVQYIQQLYLYHPTTSSQSVPFSNGSAVVGAFSSAPGAGAQSRTAASYINFNCADTTSSSDSCGMYAYTVLLIAP